jgi:hypothetical protein
MSGFGLAWLKVAIAAFLLMAPLGAATGSMTNQSKLLDLLQHPFLKISLGVRSVVFLGILLLMTAKPELLESLGIVGGSVVLGLAAPLLTPNRESALSTSDKGGFS